MKKILIAIALFSGLHAAAQSGTVYSPQINQMTFQSFIEQEFINNFSTRLQNMGLSGLCYTKFQIDSLGRPYNIRVSPGTPDTLVRFLKECLAKTNGYWRNLNGGKADPNEYLIQPLQYTLQKDGQANLVTTGSLTLFYFLTPANGPQPVKVVFLPKIEYMSPYECFKGPRYRMKAKKAE
jgi:hypothetical protein